ncbi:hypothetical protein HDC92_004958 [Pedobacter sp. AK017]|uniref:MauE/DoxX family redox-associated membrane protein n=1 Tax=Pedobacter sp. AK017 TaxID=2723073 RepID=UPI0016216D10|nr:MauE/DoxX family redox-associated membrane protein [Pedobacter sp. AK017]MBB5441251.1 hypothetical protein [Pedobacter sp. AK017]
MKVKQILVFSCSALLILLFTYAAWDKVLDHQTFLHQMRRSPFPFMDIWAIALVWLVPMAEVLVAVFLWLPHWRMRGLIASLLLLAVFELYIGGMLFSGKELPCTCSGVFNMSWGNHLIFNLVFIVIAGMGLLAMGSKWPLRRSSSRTEGRDLLLMHSSRDPSSLRFPREDGRGPDDERLKQDRT